MGFSNRLKAFKLQMFIRAPMSATASSNYYLEPLDQTSSLWGLGEYVASPIEGQRPLSAQKQLWNENEASFP